MNELGLYGLYERYDMGEAIVREDRMNILKKSCYDLHMRVERYISENLPSADDAFIRK